MRSRSPNRCGTSSASRSPARCARPAGTTNANLASGEIEVLCHEIEVLNPAVTPRSSFDEDNLPENVRLTASRHRPAPPADAEQPDVALQDRRAFRRFLDDNGFIDVETPMLTKPPEGARDYLVPSASIRASSSHCPNRRSSSSNC